MMSGSLEFWMARFFPLALLAFLPFVVGLRPSSIKKSSIRTFNPLFAVNEKSALLGSPVVISPTNLDANNGAPLPSSVVTVIIPSNEAQSFFAIKPFNEQSMGDQDSFFFDSF